MGSYEDTAIDAVRDWLMELLKKRDWCQARIVGSALEILVGGRGRRGGTVDEAQTTERLR